MTMNAMVEYLEKKGFMADKVYLKDDKAYRFTIRKNGKEATAIYKYNPYKSAVEVNPDQKKFLDDLINQRNDWYGESKYVVYDEVVFTTRDDAENTLNGLRDIIDVYGCATVRDLGELSEWSNDYDGMTNMGWNNLADAKVIRVRSGYILGMPRPKKLMSYEKNKENDMKTINAKAEFDKAVQNYEEYIRQDLEATAKLVLNSKFGVNAQFGNQIKDVIFSPPATIVKWKDGTKTVVKADEEEYDPEKGLAMAISKKVLGNNYSYYNTFKKWLKKAPNQSQTIHSNTSTVIGTVHSIETTQDGLYASIGLNTSAEARNLIQSIMEEKAPQET